MKKQPAPSLARFDREYNGWNNPNSERMLFKRRGHSSIARYDRESRRKPKKPPADYAPLIKAFFYAAIAYFVWMGVHEASHYFSCTLLGDSAHIISLVPNPLIACFSPAGQTPTEAFIYFMAPYMTALITLIALSAAENRLLRLLSYAAFFNLQYNLLATSVLDGEYFDGKNDLVRLIENADSAGANNQTIVEMYLYAVYFMIILAWVLFIFLYGKDFIRTTSTRFYLPAFTFFIVLYALSTMLLYPRYMTSDTAYQALSIARTFFTITSQSASFALFSETLGSMKTTPAFFSFPMLSATNGFLYIE